MRGHEDVAVNATGLSRIALAFLILGVLVGGIALGRVVTAITQPVRPMSTATPTPSSSAPAIGLPVSDVPGEDLERLPRYPGSVRTEYEISVDERYRLRITEFMVDAPLEEVRLFYQAVIDDHGWEIADIGYTGGEWTYVLVDGRTEALIELEVTSRYAEIDLQVSRPITTPEPTPTPEPTSEPTAQPTARPPAPPPPPTDDDDDDDSDDFGSDG